MEQLHNGKVRTEVFFHIEGRQAKWMSRAEVEAEIRRHAKRIDYSEECISKLNDCLKALDED